MKIENCTFIVSGGSSGLGLATASDLLASKAYVDALLQTVKWISVTKAPLRGVVSCAGVGTAAKIIDRDGEPHSLNLWDFTIAVNLTGTFNLVRLALKHMVKTDPEDGSDGERGVIILVSSSAAFEGQPGQTAYSATKGALRSMTLPLARDLSRHAIRVVTIAPGMPDKTKKNLAEEGVVRVRETVKWAIGCAYVNGETIRLSGAGRLPAKL
ncbi:hypothetical protein BD779DRAFT_1612982 [Infundibulicybe gibba]|nr:hypothetical protein BD779DRAFT_1612982 [Infundibulicybe gibba]